MKQSTNKEIQLLKINGGCLLLEVNTKYISSSVLSVLAQNECQVRVKILMFSTNK